MHYRRGREKQIQTHRSPASCIENKKKERRAETIVVAAWRQDCFLKQRSHSPLTPIHKRILLSHNSSSCLCRLWIWYLQRTTLLEARRREEVAGGFQQRNDFLAKPDEILFLHDCHASFAHVSVLQRKNLLNIVKTTASRHKRKLWHLARLHTRS